MGWNCILRVTIIYLYESLFSSELIENFLVSLAIQYHMKCDYSILKSTEESW